MDCNWLWICYASQFNRNPILSVHIIKLSRGTNISFPTLRRKETCTGTLQSLLNYLRPFKEYRALRFVDVHTTNIVDNAMSSAFLAANSKITYLSYSNVKKIIIKQQCVLLPSVNLSREAPLELFLSIARLDDPVLHISSTEAIVLMVQSTASLDTSYPKSLTVQSNVVPRHDIAVLDDHYVWHYGQRKEVLLTLPLFLQTYSRFTEQIRSPSRTDLYLSTLISRLTTTFKTTQERWKKILQFEKRILY